MLVLNRILPSVCPRLDNIEITFISFVYDANLAVVDYS